MYVAVVVVVNDILAGMGKINRFILRGDIRSAIIIILKYTNINSYNNYVIIVTNDVC